jgi:hypothetical protein
MHIALFRPFPLEFLYIGLGTCTYEYLGYYIVVAAFVQQCAMVWKGLLDPAIFPFFAHNIHV